MTEPKSQSDLINEAYLSCIRSVLIIDDDYPTMEGLLRKDSKAVEGEVDAPDYTYKADAADVVRIIDEFRHHQPPLLVDIHDGANISLEADPMSAELEMVKHLHQSDLVVLDYSLDPLKKDDPSKAIAVLRMLAKNSHFNLVIMHSQSKPHVVFEAIALGMLDDKLPPLPCPPGDITAGVEYLEELDVEHFATLSGLLSADHAAYLAIRDDPKILHDSERMIKFPFNSFTDKCDELSVAEDKRLGIICKILQDHHASHKEKMTEAANFGQLSYSDATDRGSIQWLKSDTLFVGFTEKIQKDNLIDEMRKALVQWNPQPPRLLMRKLVVELDENGATAENIALGTKHASARWYRDLLAAEETSRNAHVLDLVSRHTETLLAVVEDDLAKFAKEVISLDNEGTPEQICNAHFGVDLECNEQGMTAITEHNHLISTIPVKGSELTTGHIFKTNNKYWLCLSAACDLVSGQKSRAKAKVFGNSGVPILAVGLHEVSEADAAASATDKRFIYLKNGSKLSFLCVTNPKFSPSATWDWHNFMSTDHGRFAENTKIMDLFRMEDSDGSMVVKTHRAKVVGQLRYTYAAALAIELGNQMTRIGLDYVKRIS